MAGGAYSIKTESLVLFGVTWLAIILRTISRLTFAGIKNFQLDDYVMPLSGLGHVFAIVVVNIVGWKWGDLSNNLMLPEQRAALDPSDEEFRLRVGGSKTQLIAWFIYIFTLWSLKVCMCVFYSRITDGLSHMKTRIRVGYVLIGATYLAVVFTILVGCHPFDKYWQIFPAPGNQCEPAVSRVNLLVTMVLNLLTDVYLICIPLPLLWTARMPWKKKGLLLIIFGGGFFVIVCGIFRCVVVLLDPINGAARSGSWAMRETFVAGIVDNLPMVYPLCVKIYRQAETSIRNYSTGRKPLSEGSDTKAIFQLQSHKAKSKFVHPLSMQNVTLSDSSENIVQVENVKDGRDILVVQESTVEMSPRYLVEEVQQDSLSQQANVGYAASCNHSRQPSWRGLTPDRFPRGYE